MNVSLFNLSFLHCVEKQCILACCILPEEKLVPLLLLQWLSLIVFWCKMTHQRRTLLFDYKEGDQNATFTVWCFDLRKKEIFAITLQSSFSRNIKKKILKNSCVFWRCPNVWVDVSFPLKERVRLVTKSNWSHDDSIKQSPVSWTKTPSSSTGWKLALWAKVEPTETKTKPPPCKSYYKSVKVKITL